jgi:SAM-dependent methyltransferase
VNPTGRFADRAADYVVGRPSYPDAAIDALFDGLGDPRDVYVADIGAGTGISSRLLAARGAHVIAIEPNAAMRYAAESHHLVDWRAAAAESTGLEEASVDLVTAFQAFHWFEQHGAMREMIRILRPGGRAALVYNERDESDPFTRDYGDIVRRYKTDDTERRRNEGREIFETFEAWHQPRRLFFPNEHVLDVNGVLSRTRSTSYLPKEGDVAEALNAEVRALFERYARDGRVTMVMNTIVSIGDVGGDGG